MSQGISKQFKADKKVIDLVRAMEKAFEITNDTQSLPNKAQYLEKTIIELLKQITECCLFVRQFTSHGFAGESTDMNKIKQVLTFRKDGFLD